MFGLQKVWKNKQKKNHQKGLGVGNGKSGFKKRNKDSNQKNNKNARYILWNQRN